MALSTALHLPVLGQRCRLMATLWLGRLGVLGLLNYALYGSIASSPLLHSPSRDLHLWKPGGELLVSIVDSVRPAFEATSVALGTVAAVALVASIGLSTFAWRTIATTPGSCGIRLCFSAARRLPAFALLSVYTLLLTLAIAWIWLDLVPLLGTLCLPALGERYTDLAQLALLASFLALLAGIFILADITRSLLALRTIGVGPAIVHALRLMRSHAMLVLGQASMRFSAVVLLQVAHLWLLARAHWFYASSVRCIAAVVTTELAALGAIWLRLSFIEWLVNYVRHRSA